MLKTHYFFSGKSSAEVVEIIMGSDIGIAISPRGANALEFSRSICRYQLGIVETGSGTTVVLEWARLLVWIWAIGCFAMPFSGGLLGLVPGLVMLSMWVGGKPLKAMLKKEASSHKNDW